MDKKKMDCKIVFLRIVLVGLLLCIPNIVWSMEPSSDNYSSASQILKSKWSSSITAQDAYSSEEVEFSPNEIIIKFKKKVSDVLEKEKHKDLKNIALPMDLKKIIQQNKISKIKHILPNFKKQKERINRLAKHKDHINLSKIDEKIFKRLKRKSRKIKVPDLDRIYKITLSPENKKELREIISELQKNTNVEYAELNYIFKASVTPNDPLFDLQWSLNNTGQTGGVSDSDIDASEAWSIHSDNSSNDIVVAVIDTGVDYNHRDLVNQMWTDPNGIYGYDSLNEDYDPIDDHGHGTHCAGIIAAEGDNQSDISGVVWNAKIMALKFLNDRGIGNLENAIEAITFAVDNGADVLSNSWGSEGSYLDANEIQSLQEVFDYAHEMGVVSFAAAGNDNQNLASYYPACCEHVISVAATDHGDSKALCSNYGDWVDVAAPGVDILSLRASGTNIGNVYDIYNTYASGTSMACPVVAGLAALILEEDPNLDPNEISNLIFGTVDPIDLGICLSNGRVNGEAEIRAAKGRGVLFTDRLFYTYLDSIKITLVDVDLRGQNSVTVKVEYSSGDIVSSATLSPTSSNSAVFVGNVATSLIPINTNDTILQIDHEDTITVSYTDSSDEDGNQRNILAYATADCEGPEVSSIDLNVLGSVIELNCMTDEPAIVTLKCSTTCGQPYELSASSDEYESQTYNLDHNSYIVNGDIDPNTNYYYIVQAEDELGNISTYDNGGNCFSFTTNQPLGDIYVSNVSDPNEDGSASHPFDTIQEALNVAWESGATWNSDVIHLEDGVYKGLGNRDLRTYGKDVTVQGNNPEDCIIDCQAMGRGFVFIFGEDPNTVIENLSIFAGKASTDLDKSHVNRKYYNGGGVYCLESLPTIKNCIIEGCLAGDFGGGLYIESTLRTYPNNP